MHDHTSRSSRQGSFYAHPNPLGCFLNAFMVKSSNFELGWTIILTIFKSMIPSTDKKDTCLWRSPFMIAISLGTGNSKVFSVIN